ncbi:hypothetical protein LXL04_027566 [Taraxacum kok-saghyz]
MLGSDHHSDAFSLFSLAAFPPATTYQFRYPFDREDELSGSPSKRKRAKAASAASSQANVETSSRTDVAVVPEKQSKFNKKWDLVKKDTIHTVHYLWAMQLVEVEEGAEGGHMPIWKLRDIQQVETERYSSKE